MSLLLSNLSLEEDGSPTFFELSMAGSLSQSFKPAFDYLVNVLFERNPQSTWASHLMVYRNETFFALLALVERHYLKLFNAGFCENFYGMKREMANADGGKTLVNSRKLTSLVELVLLPYLCGRFPTVLKINESACLGFALAYMFKKTRYYSPWHLMQGLVLTRLGADDAKLGTESFSLVQKFANALRMGIVASAVLFKIAEYYYSNENRAMREANQVHMQVPPPPQQLLPQVKLDPRLCPLCGNARTEPALSPSGYMFCYQCLADHVSKHHTCPLTNLPCHPQDIRKVFVV
ncbi:hypothetical protein BASA81_006785 [Batrachochytrium salamandrivorans]|nr:hypothetical protein BASA81_006785 [Batrachochytrium salamandrivorans]